MHNSGTACEVCRQHECPYPELCEQVRGSRRRERDAIAEAYLYRLHWQAAASCIAFNAGRLRPRGADERRVIETAKTANLGPFWSGKTDGWLADG